MINQTIGLMMVVRNEIKRIGKCLDWHLPYVDEVSICDQSSTDGTNQLLQEYKDKSKIPFRLWTDNPRGYCEPSKQITADLLKADWILYVDADEKFPIEFLKQMHNIVDIAKVDGFRFPRYNYFEVQVYDDNVPITPKWVTVLHPAKDPQLRLTRRSLSKFPVYLHHRVRIFNAKGEKLMVDLPYPIEHKKTVKDQLEDNKRYAIANDRSKR
jgi:glycosyltransferase involved in cell wall biosynthesis